MDEREAAWASLHDVVAAMPGWAVGPCTFHGEVARWYVAVIHVAVRGRQAKREAIEATGTTEVAHCALAGVVATGADAG